MYIFTKRGDSLGSISTLVGERIRNFRKMQGMTLQQLADRIHKSRATLSKYETGEITLDVESLFDIANALGLDINCLIEYQSKRPTQPVALNPHINSPFYQSNVLYFYFYDGRSNQLKDGIINIHKNGDGNQHESTFSIRTGRSSKLYYTGKVLYSDMLIRFSFVNQYNSLEEDLLYIFNPLEFRDFTEGLLCGISSTDLMPCAFKCIVTLTPQEATAELKEHLLFTSKELLRWRKLNMLIVDNHGYHL